MNEFSILVVDDDPDFLKGIIRNLNVKFKSLDIHGASSAEKALDILRDNPVGVMLSDLRMPGLSGLDLLSLSREINPHICTIMLTGFATVDNAVAALKQGAWDFITKPVEREALFHAVEKAVKHYGIVSENQRLNEMIRTLKSDQEPTYQSAAMKQLMQKSKAVAMTDYTVLITGESGSGKEYIARIIHSLSKRGSAMCYALNCPAIPEPLLESELFGHVKGAFTGADRTRDGFFLSANNGTLILDEIGDISLSIQAKLLKFLQDKEVKPVGSSSSKKTDVRIIALTNQDLRQKIADGTFREDLYYRLNVLSLEVPPLRDRIQDIPFLIRKFILQTCEELEIEPMEVDPGALAHITSQPWHGNIRELINYIRRLVVFSSGRTIDLSLIRLVDGKPEDGPSRDSSVPILYKQAKQEALDIFSRNYLISLFELTRGNISESSRISGLERASIQKIIKRLSIDMNRFRS